MSQTPHTDKIAALGDREFLTLDEVLRRFGIGKTTGYELANQNKLPIPTIRIGRQFRFSRRALERLLEQQHGGSATAA
ncbi:MAG: helix-turn-helix domain-containing protein [Chloroflexota bacterium]|nr:helix-turn-helix domain-containing protein [Chloroflexota bacterium]